jgi:hypothetical protein
LLEDIQAYGKFYEIIVGNEIFLLQKYFISDVINPRGIASIVAARVQQKTVSVKRLYYENRYIAG